MDLVKPQRRTNIFDYWNPNKKMKIKEESHIPKISITRLEDFSNEVFYEIFSYLDVYHVYKSFYSLNQRLQNLLINSTLPLQINLSSISKSAFQYYHRQILMPNKHRITLLRLAHVFLPDLIFFPVRTASDFTRLKTLIFDHCKSRYLSNILHHLVNLQDLKSLVIILHENILKIDELYRAIFRLPVLKYCKISFDKRSKRYTLPLITNLTSSIEHLVLDYELTLNELDVILSCVPHLHRLSIQSLENSNLNFSGDLFSKKLDNLQYFFVNTMKITFHQFQQISECLFTSLEQLHLSIQNDQEYLNAKQWERLILSNIPKLRIFDFHYTTFVDTDIEITKVFYDSTIEQFSSLFWMERKWFFSYQWSKGSYQNQVTLFSTNPYRRNEYVLHGFVRNNLNSTYGKRKMSMVDHLDIKNEEINNYGYYFPKTTKLTLSASFQNNSRSLPVILKTMVPLKQLKTLIIHQYDICLGHFLQLLIASPNIHTLVFDCQSNNEMKVLLKDKTESFRLLIENNKITTITIHEKWSIDNIQFLITLCPRMQNLTIDIYRYNIESLLRFILSQTKSNLQHLSLLCIKTDNHINTGTLKTMIETEELLDNYSMKTIKNELYLWW